MMKRLLLAGSVATLCWSNAFAQTSEPIEAVDLEEDVIIVTGSRIPTDTTLSAPSPVQAVTIDEFRRSGDIDIVTSLRNLPALQGSDPSSLSAAQGLATGLSTLNLRQLGTNRTLVLQDGRRHVPGVAGSQAVDVGAIPQALVKRTEVLTGGASSVYGADAVSGVVNFIMRDGSDFDGIEYRFQSGISDKGDAEDFFGSVAGGGEFANGRGNAVFAIEASHATSILAGDRSFAGTSGFTLNESGPLLNNFLGLDPAAENAFLPNQTLPISSTLGIISFDEGFGGSPFFDIAGGGFGFLSGGQTFDPAVDTVPETAPGIPRVQVIDPVTGQLRAFNPGLAISGFNAIGGDSITGGNADTEILIPEQTRLSFNAGAAYEINDNVEFFVDGKFVFNDAFDAGTIPFSDDIPLALDNAFIPAELLAQANEIGAIGFGVARDILDREVDGSSPTERTTIRGSAGFRGESFVDGIDYEVAYSWGRTEVNATVGNARLNDRYFTALDAVALTADDVAAFAAAGSTAAGASTLNAIRGGMDITIDSTSALAGDIVCRSEVTGLPAPSNVPFGVGGPPLFQDGTSINGTDVGSRTRPVSFSIGDGQCAPINILGLNSIQGAGADFAFVDLQNKTQITQEQLLGTIYGDTSNYLQLPAGPLGFAAGFEWRKDSSQFTPDSFLRADEDLVNNNGSLVLPSPTNGENVNVFEVFGELRVPLLKDLKFAELLEVTAAGRVSDYNTIGGTETYSFSGRYSPVDFLTLRGTFSEAIRAPNIGELFAPQTAAVIGVNADPCDNGNIDNGSANRVSNCLEFVNEGFDSANELTAFVTGTSGGNPNLSEETSNSITLGAVFQPRGLFNGALDNLILTVDYYDIEIENAIGSLTGAAIAAACVDLPSTDNQFCDAIQRVPREDGGEISGFTSGNINLSLLEAEGIDFDVRYGFDLPSSGTRDWGSIDLSLVGTRFLTRRTESDPVINEVIASETDPVEQELLATDQAFVSDLLGVFGNPELVFNAGVDWNFDRWSFGGTWRFEQSTSNFSNADRNDVEIENGAVVVSDNVGLADPSQLDTGDGHEFDVSFNYDHSEAFGVYGGVSNLTDEEPFLGSLSRPVGPRGRFFFLGVQGKF